MWRLVHTRSSSVQTYRSFNQFVINHLKDFILNNIQTINFLLSRLYYDSVQIAVTEKAPSRFDCEQSLPFLLRHFKMKTRAWSEGRSPRETRESHNLSFFSAPLSSLHLALRKHAINIKLNKHKHKHYACTYTINVDLTTLQLVRVCCPSLWPSLNETLLPFFQSLAFLWKDCPPNQNEFQQSTLHNT